MYLSRVTPTNAEGLDSAFEQKADHAFVGREIESVVFVDLGWRHDQRPLPDSWRGGRVLDQLEQFVAEHDGPRCRREILADLEGAGIDHRRHTAILGEVIEIVLQSAPQA